MCVRRTDKSEWLGQRFCCAVADICQPLIPCRAETPQLQLCKCTFAEPGCLGCRWHSSVCALGEASTTRTAETGKYRSFCVCKLSICVRAWPALTVQMMASNTTQLCCRYQNDPLAAIFCSRITIAALITIHAKEADHELRSLCAWSWPVR